MPARTNVCLSVGKSIIFYNTSQLGNIPVEYDWVISEDSYYRPTQK